MWKKQFLFTIAIVMASAAIGFSVNAFRKDSIPLVQDWEITITEKLEKEAQGQVGIVQLPEMKNLYQSNRILLLDARPKDFYDLEHIPGAKNVPLEEAEKKLPGLLKGISPNVRIITYCEGGSCHTSHELARKILEAGHTAVAVYQGGITQWLEEGLPIESDA